MATNMNEAVEQGARIFDAVEPKLEKAHGDILKLIPVLNDGAAFGMMGALELGALRGEVFDIAGDIGRAYGRVYALHRKLTDIAIKNDADLPQPRDGGGHR